MVFINASLQRDEAQAVERLLAELLARYAADLSTNAMSGCVRVRQAIANGLKAEQVRHYGEQAWPKAAA